MKRWIVLAIFCTTTLLFGIGTPHKEITNAPVPDVQTIGKKVSVDPDFGKIPLYFIANKGQMDEQALFYARTSRYTLWATKQGLVFDSFKKDNVKGKIEGRDVSRLIFLNALPNPEIVPGKLSDYRVNFLKGNDKSGWHTQVPTSERVCYKNLYNAIDLEVYGVEKLIEYDWVIKPGGNPTDIRFAYQNIKKSFIDETGNLVIQTAFGEWLHKKPVGYQVINGKREGVEIAFIKRGKSSHIYGFKVSHYDKNYELIIDPRVVAFSSFLGGSDGDSIRSIAIDGSGAIIVGGGTYSSDFPTVNAYHGNYSADYDAIISKILPDGSALVFSTYLGGSGETALNAIDVDGSGAIYAGGNTESTDFPLVNAYQSTFQSYISGFVSKLSADGTSLIYSTYLGGNNGVSIKDLAVNSGGEAYVTGETSSTNFPVQNPIQAAIGGESDIFVTKFSTSGNSLVYSTYLGGSFEDVYPFLAIDASGAAYVGGRTLSEDFPTVNAYQATPNGSFDGFVSKISPDGSFLVFSTYLGGSNRDYIFGLDANNTGVVVTGTTLSPDFPITAGAYDTTFNGDPDIEDTDNFITKLSSSGDSLIFSTYMSWESGFNQCKDVLAASDGSTYVIGEANKNYFPWVDGLKPDYIMGPGAFVSKLTPDGSTLSFSTQLSNMCTECILYLNCIDVDADGNIYLGGSADEYFYAYRGFQDTCAGIADGFILKIVSDVANEISLTTPSGYENWIAGSTQTIHWTAPTLVQNVKIEYSTDYGSYWTSITDSTPNTGSYFWTIPSADSSDCMVRVCDVESPTIFPCSENANNFTISTPLLLTSPNGGESWAGGSTHNITWVDNGTIPNVSIAYSTDYGETWIPIAGPIANSGSYSWTVPETPSNSCLVRVSDPTETNTDWSDYAFTVYSLSAPFIAVTSPNGGEEWVGGALHNITWTSTSAVTEVNIDYSRDGGATWIPIAGPIVNTGSYEWTLPPNPSTNCLVMISHAGGTVSDISNAAFTVKAPPLPQGERDALIALYNSTGGAGWNDSYNWRNPANPSEFNAPGTEYTWYGITCSADYSHVEKIYLCNNNLNGTIPDLGGLTELKELDMCGNFLSANIPAGLNSLTHLTKLSLYSSGLSGPLPDLGGLSNLVWLKLDGNNLTGSIPGWLNNLTNLEYLFIQDNGFTGLIPDLSGLTKLKGLNIGTNNLTGTIPTWLNSLTNLETLSLNNNYLSGTIPDLGNLVGLHTLNLSNNLLTGAFPSWISGLTNLQYLHLNNNQFTGTIEGVANLINLYYLYLGKNGFSGSIPNLSGLTQLTRLDLSSNQFSGSIPATLGQLTSLHVLYLNGNKLTGSIPSSLSNLTALYVNYLDIRWNGIFTSDSALKTFLDSKQYGWGWVSTQTIAPTGLSTSEVSYNSVKVSWTPIVYTDNTGCYEVYYSTTPGGGYVYAGATANKTTNNYTVTNLNKGITYYFRVLTKTYSHYSNSNTVISDYSSEVSATTLLPTITVTAPNGGESWEGTTGHNITWSYTGTLTNVKIDYSADNGASWNAVTASTANTGSYAWTVPNTPSTDCLVRVGDAASAASDQSDALFTILPQRTITLTSPNGGESWMGNTTYPITWTSTGAISYVKIEYSINNGGSWNTITASIDNTGNYDWAVPNSPSTDCLIRVSDTASLAADISNATFAITPPIIPQSERDALIALYNNTNGDIWLVKTLWRKPGDPSQFNDRGTENTWYGITCNTANTHVTGIQLSGNSLNGTLPDLTGLTQLQTLDLGGNSLHGSIPAWLNTLTNLTTLDLAGCFFTGSIPDLSNLSQLKELSLGGNSLTGTIPSGLNNLANLEFLSLLYNQLSGTLPDLGGLTKLKTLYLHNNQITGDIPAWLNNLTDLETLNLSANTFNGTIANLGGLTKLKTLNFSANQLPGNIPAWLNNLTDLETLKLATNSFSGTIPNLQNLTLLQNLELGYNQLTGSVPTWINQLGALKTLDLRSNMLSGEIPDLTGMNQLESLVLSQNQLSGAIPGSLNTLPNLKGIYLSSNQLTGAIPNLGACTALQYLYLDNNQLSGTLPSALGNLLNLKGLDLGINRFSGGIPQEFGNLSNLKILTLKSNQLVGNMPDSLANLVNLNSDGLNLSWNGLYTNNSSLHQFLDSKYANGGYCINSTQTLAPADLRTTYIGRDYVQLKWTPIEFNYYTGGYQVYYSTTPGGDYVLAGTTTDKTVDMFTVSDLTQATQYYFIIKTISQPHTNNQNTIVSDPGTEVSAKTSNPSLYFTYPTGGETWTAGTTHELNWVRAGIIENIKLEYSIDSGNTWITIVESMPWTGTYNWSVPNTPATTCKVRVSDTAGLASSVNNGTFTILEQHTIHVTSPNGGEIWEAGNPHPITWTSTGNITNVYISYSTDNGNTWNIIQGEYSNSGTYSWTPTNNISSTNCLIKIMEYNCFWVVDQSDAVFTIKPLRTINVTSPSINGISWEGNTVHPITWTHTGDIPNVKIEYSIDNGGSWNTITASTPNNNTYDWTVPNTPSTSCLVKVSDIAGPAVDQSNSVFTIFEQRTITVTTPNGGESWEGTTVHPITWTFTGSIPNVKIEYSINNGSTWNTVIASTANTGSYNWTVINAPSASCLVKVTDTAGPATDQSNAVFTILTHRTIYVNSPNGGESWEGNTSHAITWNYTGAISNVKIEYSTNNGSSWNTVIASTANTGSYNWTVANTPSAACLVKVSDIDGPAAGQSYAVFTIVTARTITVTSPNGGETWEGVTNHNITWTSTGDIAFVSIQYSTNNGSSWTVINSSASNNGSYDWTVSGSPSTTCLVKVKDYAGPAVDQSDAVFTITAQRTITVTSPNGGESWEGNTVKTLRWNISGDINNVKIEYSTDNGSSWNIITASTPTGKPFGTYDWTVPNTPSTNCLIKVTDTAGPASDQSNAVFTIVPERTITVTSPNGGESWEGNTAQSIAWASTGSISNVKIEYSTNGGSSWNTIAASTANTGSYNWTVPNTPSTNCLIKVTDTAGPASDQSNAVFTIVTERTVTVTAPNGGETWEGNTAHSITWNSTGSISNVMIEYSTNNGSSWNTLTASTANTGSYNWTVPNTASTDCLVKVNDIDGPALDQSNGVFTIVTERTVTVTAPNGGETWEGNTSHAITWTSTGAVNNVQIEYSTNNGSSWNTITASTANTGSYNWTVPNTASTNCLVKVNDLDGPALDQSNAVFTILAERTLTVTAPNGGETWEGNTAHSITWTSTGAIINVMIEYSTTGGSSWNTITASTTNTGSYNWTVANSASTNCLIKVSDAAGPASDQSNAVFTILTERTVTVTAPNGGESVEGNTSYSITWTSTGNIPDVKIEYSTNSGSSWNTITASTANTGSYNWTIANSPSAACLVKVSDVAGPASDQSNALFTIVAYRSITVTSPNGGESWEGNTSYPVTWTSTGSIANVMIEYSTNSGSSWNTITTSTANSGSYNWTVPNSPSTNCLVKVSDVAGPASDQSNAVFAIVAYRTITVTLPNGAENLLANTIYPIAWTYTGNIPNVMIQYSTNNGSSWNTITASTTNSGSYNWTIPTSASTSCLVKVSDVAGPAVDQSNAVFTISNVTYCTSSGNSQTRGYISRVQIGSLNNPSGSSAYTNFTSLNANVTSGGSASVSLTPTFVSGTYTEYWKIWIDYNRDGDFGDSGENVFSKSGSSTVTGSFTVSASAAKGTTRMRVSMKSQNYPSNCGSFNYGEVEDYTVNIQ